MRHLSSLITVLTASSLVLAACGTVDSESTMPDEEVGTASQALAPSRTPWQMHNGLEVSGSNPNGLLPFSCAPGSHGANCEYDIVCNASPLTGPCLTSVPASNDAGWGPAPDGNVIGFAIPSRVCAAPISCLAYGDFTYFQTFVDIPAGSTVTQFSIAFSGMDDGSRITIYNSLYPTGIVVPGSYVYLGGSGTSNLQSYVVAGEVNRVVVTQVDDCCSQNNLHSAVVVLNGTNVQTAVCGNGILEPGEQCDDGNTTNGDGCAASCKTETCVSLRRGTGNVEDAWIAAGDTNTNNGASSTLTTGGLTVGKALIKFDLSGIPSTATFTKGFLRFNQTYAGNAPVYPHLITAPWSEGTVTYANFNDAYDPAPFTSNVLGPGPIPALYFDMIPTLQAWVSGAVPNHGVLIEQGLVGQRILRSSEDAVAAARPGLQFCYTN